MTIGDYKVITITHKSADLKDMGQFVLSDSGEASVQHQLEQLKARMGIRGVLYMPTCNRILYFFRYTGTLDAAFLRQFVTLLYPGCSAPAEAFITHEGAEAIRHLFEVAASVDSLVVGEREIIRQLRESYHSCKAQELTGDSIRLALDAAIRVGKRVYAQTRIGEKQVSVVSLAIKKLMEQAIPEDSRILLVGAGQTNALVCKFLKKYGFTNVAIFNRTASKAFDLARYVGGASYSLADLEHYDKGFDCMVVCTAAVEPVIHLQNFPQLLNGEAGEKVVIDLAIPNNVAAEVVAQHDFNYIEIDGLKALAEKNLAFRGQEVIKAKEIIHECLEDFSWLYKERQLERALRDMPDQIKAVKAKAMTEVFAKEMDGLDDETRALMQRMLDYMEKKCIGIPMKVAKQTILG